MTSTKFRVWDPIMALVILSRLKFQKIYNLYEVEIITDSTHIKNLHQNLLSLLFIFYKLSIFFLEHTKETLIVSEDDKDKNIKTEKLCICEEENENTPKFDLFIR